MGNLDERLIQLLAHWDYETSDAEVVRLGPAALGRLLDAQDGKGSLWREGTDPRDFESAQRSATAAFGASNLDAALAEVRRRGWSDRDIARSGLGNVRDPRVVGFLVELAGSKDSSDRLEAASRLGEHRDPRATEALVRALTDRASTVRTTAIESLGDAGDLAGIPALQAAAKREKASWVVASAKAAIARIRKAERKKSRP